jgi:DNA-binding transcriptional MerR regulator
MTSKEPANTDPEYTVPRYSISHAVGRLGGSPNPATIREYIRCKLLSPFRDSQGRLLFSDKDIVTIRKLHEQRAKRRGQSVHRVTSTFMG